MDSLFGQDVNVEVFIDDIAIFTTGSFEKHLEALRDVLSFLSSENFCINKSKCTFAAAEVDYLGHAINSSGIKPQLQKISTILNLEAPTNVKQLRRFIGLVIYYRDFIPQRSHVLTPLTSLTSPKIHFHWSTSCQAAFKKLKLALATSTLLACIGAGNIHITRLPKPTFTLHHRTRRKRLPVGKHHQPTYFSLVN